METREPKFRGCGIHIPMQPINDLIIGDTCFDADAGPLMWNGEQWITTLENAWDNSIPQKNIDINLKLRF